MNPIFHVPPGSFTPHTQMAFQLRVKLLLSRPLWAVSLCHGVWHKEDEEGGGGFFVSDLVQPASASTGESERRLCLRVEFVRV